MNYLRLIGVFIIVLGIYLMSNYILLFFAVITNQTEFNDEHLIPIFTSSNLVLAYPLLILGAILTSKRITDRIKKI